MLVVKEFIIKDIINYETLNDVNILEELEQGELYVILDLIMMGNKCQYEEAECIFRQALESIGLTEIINKIAECLVGEKTENEDQTVDRNKYKNFSDILLEFFEQLQIVDDTISYSDFMNMSTQMMYKYANGVQKRYINERNVAYRESFENAVILLGALSGKVKEPPQISENDINKTKTSLADRVKAFAASRRTG